jgi:hypothetical protein
MADPDLKRELENLREQLEALAGESHPEMEVLSETADDPARRAKNLLRELDWTALIAQVGEQLKGLGNDVKESKPKALAAAFVAGFLLGRTSAR